MWITFTPRWPLVFQLLSVAVLVEMKYEVVIERVENAFGSEDKAVMMDTLRVKKWNHTTLSSQSVELTETF